MADDRTRVITAAEAERILAEQMRAARAAKLVGDKVVFYCTNGHKLVVSAKYAGKRGKCDKPGCGVTVVIPSVAADVPDVSEEPVAEEEPAEVDAETTESVEAEAEEEASAEEAQAETEGDAEENAEATEETWQFMAGGESAKGSGSADDDAASGGWTEQREPAERAAVADNPVARLVARLWEEREHGGIVELHLTGGSVILPEWYEAKWSRGTHGLFASQTADGTITLTAVAWEAIQKVVVRQVSGLPDGMFE